jgi:hypothetical protein
MKDEEFRALIGWMCMIWIFIAVFCSLVFGQFAPQIAMASFCLGMVFGWQFSDGHYRNKYEELMQKILKNSKEAKA